MLETISALLRLSASSARLLSPEPVICSSVSSSACAPTRITATLPATETVPPAAPARVKFFVDLAESASTEISLTALTTPWIDACALLCTTSAFKETPTPTVPPPPMPPITSMVVTLFVALTATSCVV